MMRVSKDESTIKNNIFVLATIKLATSFKVLYHKAPQCALFLVAAAIYNDGIMVCPPH